LKYKTKKRDDHQLEITVEIEAENFETYKRQAARKISNKAKISGFRPGKAPYDVIKRLYGEEVISEEAVETAIQDVYPNIIKETEIKPYGPGSLDEIIENDPPKFKFIVPLEPTVDLKSYLDVRHPYSIPEITDDDVNKVIENLQLNYSTAKDKAGNAAAGDLVAVKIDATLTNPDENQDAEILKSSPHQVVIGKDDEDVSYPFKNFSKKLIGQEKGAKVEFTHKYKKDSGFESLREKSAVFSVIIETIKELEKPELNDDFAKIVGFEKLDELVDSVRGQLTITKKEEVDNKYYDEVLEKIIEQAEIKYPPQTLENEISDVLRNFEADLSGRNMDLPTYLKLNKREKEEFIDKDIKPAAKKRLEQALIIDHISQEEKIELDKTELEQEYSRSLMHLQSDPNFYKLRKEFTIKKLSDVTVMQSATRLMNRRTLERIKAIANNEQDKVEPAEDDSSTPEENSNKDLIQEDK